MWRKFVLAVVFAVVFTACSSGEVAETGSSEPLRGLDGETVGRNAGSPSGSGEFVAAGESPEAIAAASAEGSTLCNAPDVMPAEISADFGWRVDEAVEVTHVRPFMRIGGPEGTALGQVTVTPTEIESDGTATFVWRNHETDTTELDADHAQRVHAFTPPEVRYSQTSDGALDEITNLDDVQRYFVDSTAVIEGFAGVGSDVADRLNSDAYVDLIRTPASAQIILHRFEGVSLPPGNARPSGETFELPNPFGGAPLPAVGEFSADESLDRSNCAVLRFTIRADRAASIEIMAETADLDPVNFEGFSAVHEFVLFLDATTAQPRRLTFMESSNPLDQERVSREAFVFGATQDARSVFDESASEALDVASLANGSAIRAAYSNDELSEFTEDEVICIDETVSTLNSSGGFVPSIIVVHVARLCAPERAARLWAETDSINLAAPEDRLCFAREVISIANFDFRNSLDWFQSNRFDPPNSQRDLLDEALRQFCNIDLATGVQAGLRKRGPLEQTPEIAAYCCLLYTSPSPRDRQKSRMPSSA